MESVERALAYRVKLVMVCAAKWCGISVEATGPARRNVVRVARRPSVAPWDSAPFATAELGLGTELSGAEAVPTVAVYRPQGGAPTERAAAFHSRAVSSRVHTSINRLSSSSARSVIP